jgi:hypothetical protein
MPTSEKRRLALMIAGFVVVSGVMVTTLFQARKSGGTRREVQPVPDESVVAEPRLAVPELDVARLAALVSDADPSDRVVLESEAADLVLAAARRYAPRHYAELAAPELDAELGARLCAHPSPERGKPFTARGRIAGLRARSGAAHEDQYLGRLELEDGSTAYFLVLELPAGALDLGGFVRVDGLFLKAYSSEDEVEPGTWTTGPLLVGARAERSYPSLGTVSELDPVALAEVEDADLAPEEGEPRFVPETPAEPLWRLMAYARDLPEGSVDWSRAPLLDQRLIDRILEQPAEYRGQPVRIPISVLQDGRVRLAGENPARIERYTQGWIGNTTWRSVIQFRSPVLRPDLALRDLVHGRGFFLHNFSYESSERGLRVAPLFVLQALERHVPRPSRVLMRIPWVMAGIGLGLGVTFVVLARRDRRRSLAFEEELVRRRRERRRSRGDVGTASP